MTVKKLLLTTNIAPDKSASGDVGALIPLIPNNAGRSKPYSITAADLWKLGNVVYDAAHQDFAYSGSYGSDIHTLSDWLDSVNEKYIKQFEWNFSTNPTGYAGFYFSAASDSSAGTTALNFDFYSSVAGDIEFSADDDAAVTHSCIKTVVVGWQSISIPWVGAVGTGFSQTTFTHPATGFAVDPASTLDVGMCRIDTVRYDQIVTMAVGNLELAGTAQAAAPSSLTLAAGASEVADAYAGMQVIIQGGTGAGQVRNVVASRKNLLPNSEALSGYTKTNVTVTDNVEIGPFGEMNASTVIENTAATVHFINKAINVIAGDIVTEAIYVKSLDIGSTRYPVLWLAGTGFSVEAFANFSLDGSMSYRTSAAVFEAGIEDVGGGMYRCWVKAIASADGIAYLRFAMRNTTFAGYPSYTGDGVSGLIMSCAQSQIGDLSAYIKTVGTAAVGVIIDAPWDTLPAATSTYGLYSPPAVLNGVQFALEKIDPGSKQYNVRLDRIKINQVVVDGPAADPDRYKGIPRWTYKWAGNGYGAWRGPSAVGYNWLAGWTESGIVNPDNNAVLSDAMLQMMYDSQQAYVAQFPAKQIGPFVPRYGRASWEALNQGGYVAGVWTDSTYNKWYWPDTDDWYGYTMRALLSVAQHYYLTESAQAKTILDNWMAWLDVYIIADGAYWWPPSGYGNDGVPTYTYKPVYAYTCIAAACIYKYWIDGDALALKWYRRMLDTIYATKRQTATGTCAGISRTTEGTGYTWATVNFTVNGGAVAPTATAVIAGGKVVRYTVDTPGSGITSISAEITGDGIGATCNPYLSDLLVGAFDAHHSGWEIAEIFNTYAMLINGSKPGGTVHYPISIDPVSSWDVSSGTYTTKSLSSATQDATTNGIAFSADGTKMYVVGGTNNTIYQYDLTTAWDASTGTYANKSFSVATEDTLPWGITFKPDGTKMYISGEGNVKVYQYTLATAWDVSTASFDGATFTLLISGQDGKPRGLVFNADGTTLMVAGYSNDTVFQYTLTTGWDLSSGSYASKSKWIGAESFVTGLALKPDGTMMYTCGTNNSRLYQYTLATAWDVSSASYDNKSLLVSTQDATPTGLAIKPDGIYLYVAGQTSDTTYQYGLSTSGGNDLTAFLGLIDLYQRNTTNARPSLLNADMIPIHEWDIDPYHNGSGIENPMVKDTHVRGALWTETLAPTMYAAVEYGRYSGDWTWLGKLYDLTLEFIGLPGGSTHLADTPRPSNGLMDAYTDIIGGEPLQANKRGNLDGATYVVNASKQIIIPANAGGGNVTWVRGAWAIGVTFRYEGFMADIDPDYVGDTTNYATVSATNQYVGGVYSTVIQLAASATIGATLQVYYSYRDGTLSLKGEAMSGWPMLHRDPYQGTANDGDNYMMVALYHAWRSTGDAKYKTAADRIGYALLEAGRWEGNEATFSLPIEEESGQVGFYTYFADNTPFSATIENNPGLRIRSLVLTGQTPANYAGFGLWPSWSIDAATPFTSIDFDLFDFGDAIPPSGSISYMVTIDGTPAAPPANGILSAGDIQVINLSGYAALVPSHEDVRSMSKSVSGVVDLLHFLSRTSFQLEVRNVAEDRAGVNYYAILNALNDEISLGTVITWAPDYENYPTTYHLCVGKKRNDPRRIEAKPLWIFKFDLIVLPAVQTPSSVPPFVAA